MCSKIIEHYRMKKIPKNPSFFACDFCNYITSSKKDYNKHILTLKHQNRTNRTEKSPKIPSAFQCDCGRAYNARNSLWYHKKTCQFNILNTNIESDFISDDDDSIEKDDTVSTNVIMELIKQNTEFKSLIIEQGNQLQIQQQKHYEEQKINNETIQKQTEAIKELAATGGTVNTTINNQNFNLNFFLNNTCKDAMNMSEFIENINVEFKDIEYIGRNGYVNGMTNMILSRIRELDITKRPMHCTDLKRETMYIKDNDEWNKDTPDNKALQNMMKIVARQNQYKVPLWCEEHPSSQNMDSEQFEFCIGMLKNILGDVGEEQIRLDKKVIKNISKHITVK